LKWFINILHLSSFPPRRDRGPSFCDLHRRSLFLPLMTALPGRAALFLMRLPFKYIPYNGTFLTDPSRGAPLPSFLTQTNIYPTIYPHNPFFLFFNNTFTFLAPMILAWRDFTPLFSPLMASPSLRPLPDAVHHHHPAASGLPSPLQIMESAVRFAFSPPFPVAGSSIAPRSPSSNL